MQHVDYFSGEAVAEPASPITPEEQTAAQFANFGAYQYGGPPQQVPQAITPGGYGYNQQPQSFYYNPMYQSPPQYYQPYNPYAYQQTFGIGMGNPAFGYMRQQGWQEPPQSDVTIDIKPFNPRGGEFIPPDGYEEELEKLKQEFWMEQEKAKAKATVDNIGRQQSNSYWNNGYNYYGMPYYNNPWANPQTNSVNSQYINMLKQMEQDARQARKDMTKNLAMLAHNYLGDQCDMQVFNEIYDGRTITIPGQEVVAQKAMNRLATLVPFDNSQWYRDQQAKATSQYRKYIKKDANLKETFENMALVAIEYELEEEEHRRRREQKERYNSTGYKYLIQKKLMEDYAQERGVDLSGSGKDNDTSTTSTANKIKNEILQSGMFPTLTNTAELADDGTLKITYNSTVDYGEIKNINEDRYEEQRRKFNSFLQSIPGSINLMDNTPVVAQA